MGDESYAVRIRRVLTNLGRVQITSDHAFLLDGEDVTDSVWDLDDEGFAAINPDGQPRITADGRAFLGRSLEIAFLAPEEAA